MMLRPRAKRFCSLTEIASKYELPMVRLCSITPELKLPVPVGYCGKRDSSCATDVVVPAGVPLVIRPENGLGTVAVSSLMSAWSRTGDVLRYCRGMPFNWVAEM